MLTPVCKPPLQRRCHCVSAMSRRGSHSSSMARGRGGGAMGSNANSSRTTTNGRSDSHGGSGTSTPVAGSSGAATAASLQRQTGPRMQMPPDPSRRIVDFSSPDDKCPQCKTDRYLNPKLRLLVSPCYHKMCESCLDRIFSLGPAPCPECGQVCRKYEFGVQTFQDLRVEKEVDVRRRVGKLFNKRAEDFDTLKAYNDYLEEVETILFNLINNVNVAATEARIAAYQTSNKASILANTRNLAAEGDAQRAREDSERAQRTARAARRKAREERDRIEREQDEQDLVEALAGRGNVNVETAIERKDANERQREKRMEREEQEEEEEAKRRESIAAETRAVQQQQSSSNKAAGGAGAQIKPDEGWPVPFTFDMLLDFEGPLASLDDASALFDVKPAPASMQNVQQAANASIGYDDPWITQVPEKDEAVRLRAAGYDWTLPWRRDIRMANMGISLAPLK